MNSVDEKKYQRVVGIHYKPGERAPQVILKGSGRIAEEILRQRAVGGRHTIVRDAKLLDQLYRLPIDSEIGTDLYHLVAILLSHVFAIEQRLKGEHHA